ncbi:hypothetical protein DM02DRAFT_621517 [Periconia macrospinosa]|uniref:ATPase AAA-type core domain-containing protein n=1 Tax=Periconia macrospinosa TaxID=97972 RepID=A0A2V1EGM1_9PLEO|nr:hypothetical protein DM02DRAFT_621517 [Periconia macrospinosa]
MLLAESRIEEDAGLKREEEPAATPPEDADNEKASQKKGKRKKKGACSTSLSALLNVIDVAAAHEGHVLMMTKTTPESLDAALIRPGRVYVQIGFTPATRPQIRETFVRMHNSTPEERADTSRFTSSSHSQAKKVFGKEEIKEMAEKFSKGVT